jgi:Kef-type K+ transport system membrane component KefB
VIELVRVRGPFRTLLVPLNLTWASWSTPNRKLIVAHRERRVALCWPVAGSAGLMMALANCFLFFSISSESASHDDPVAPILIALVLMAFAAAIGGRVMQRFGQAAVLGELLIGVLVGNLGYFYHQPAITVIREGDSISSIEQTALLRQLTAGEAARQILPLGPHTEEIARILEGPRGLKVLTVYSFVDAVSRIAIIILLFLVGLETSLNEMRAVGWTASLVGVLGVVLPLGLGLLVTTVLLPGSTFAAHLFIGGVLTATSVGITARVLRDLGQMDRSESKIILGAAVIDDVLGLLVLAVVTALIVHGFVSLGTIFGITLRAVLFLASSIGIGMWVTPRIVRHVARLQIENVKLLFGVGFAFVLSWLANLAGLATIIGAFAAGLILEHFFDKELEGFSLRDMLSPVESLIVPIFFVLMGLQVKLEAFNNLSVVFLAAALTAVAIVGKILSGYAAGRGLKRLAIGIGMMPRGEVGLIFAGIGRGLGVVSDSIFASIVIMVIITTMLTPPLLKLTLARNTPGAIAGPD